MDYKMITDHIEKLTGIEYACWTTKNEKGEDVRTYYPLYHDAVFDFLADFRVFADSYPIELRNHRERIEKAGIKYNTIEFMRADIKKLPADVIFAMISETIRIDRFCDGVFLDSLENGCFLKWLERIKVLDEAREIAAKIDETI